MGTNEANHAESSRTSKPRLDEVCAAREDPLEPSSGTTQSRAMASSPRMRMDLTCSSTRAQSKWMDSDSYFRATKSNMISETPTAALRPPPSTLKLATHPHLIATTIAMSKHQTSARLEDGGGQGVIWGEGQSIVCPFESS